MGTLFSRPDIVQNKLIEIAINIPQLADMLEPSDLRKLCSVSRDMNIAVDHPAVWRGQFAKIIHVRPRDLPAPLLPGRPKPFKDLCEAVEVARHYAATGNEPSRNEAFMISTVYGYLREHFSESARVLRQIVDDLERLEASGKLPPNFWSDMAIAGGITTAGGAITMGNIWATIKLPVHMAAPPTIKMAKIIKLMGAKWAKVYFYSVYGVGMATGVMTGTMGAYFTVDTLVRAKRHYDRREREMRDLRIKDLVADRRQMDLP